MKAKAMIAVTVISLLTFGYIYASQSSNTANICSGLECQSCVICECEPCDCSKSTECECN